MRCTTSVLDAQARREEPSDQGDPGEALADLTLWLGARQASPASAFECLISADDTAELSGACEVLSERVVAWEPEYAAAIIAVDGDLRVVALADWDDGLLLEDGEGMVLSARARGHRVLEVAWA